MESDSAILGTVESDPPLPIQPLFNRLLSFQQRNVRARQLAMRVQLPRLRAQAVSMSVSDDRDSSYRHRSSLSFHDLNLQLKLQKQRARKRLHQLVHAESRKNSLPSVPLQEKRHRTKEVAVLPPLIRAPLVEISPKKHAKRPPHPLSLSTEAEHSVLQKLREMRESVQRSVHTLDLQVPVSVPQKRRPNPAYRPAFRLRFLSRKARARINSVTESSQLISPVSPRDSPTSRQSLSQYPQDVFLKPRKILLQNVSRAAIVSAASNESDGDEVLFPVFS